VKLFEILAMLSSLVRYTLMKKDNLQAGGVEVIRQDVSLGLISFGNFTYDHTGEARSFRGTIRSS
jgi:hypothetical protein